MKMKKLLSFCLAISSLGWVGCGEDEPQFVQGFYYDVADNEVDLDIEFNNDLTLNSEFSVPILNYGSVRLFPASGPTGVRIGTTLNMDALVDPSILNLERTRKLPNGQSMSPYVRTDIGRLWIKATEEVATSIYFGLEPEEFYLGTAIELSFLNEAFPADLVISQRIRDHKKRPVGVITLFGPRIENDIVLAPGGFFFVTNVSELIRYAEQDKLDEPVSFNSSALVVNNKLTLDHGLMPVDETYVNRQDYQGKHKLYELLQKYRVSGKEAGLVD